MPNFPMLPAQPPMPPLLCRPLVRISPLPPRPECRRCPRSRRCRSSIFPLLVLPRPPTPKVDVFENLKKRFPKATDNEIRAALASHENHPGRAAKALENAAAKAKAKPKIDEKKIVMAFNLFDTSGDGAINFTEFQAAVDSLGFIASENMSDEQVHDMYVECDTSGDGLIQLDEFKAMMLTTLCDEAAEDRRLRFAENVNENLEITKNTSAVPVRRDEWSGLAGQKKIKQFEAAAKRQDAFQQEIAAKYGASMANMMAPAATAPPPTKGSKKAERRARRTKKSRRRRRVARAAFSERGRWARCGAQDDAAQLSKSPTRIAKLLSQSDGNGSNGAMGDGQRPRCPSRDAVSTIRPSAARRETCRLHASQQDDRGDFPSV